MVDPVPVVVVLIILVMISIVVLLDCCCCRYRYRYRSSSSCKVVILCLLFDIGMLVVLKEDMLLVALSVAICILGETDLERNNEYSGQ